MNVFMPDIRPYLDATHVIQAEVLQRSVAALGLRRPRGFFRCIAHCKLRLTGSLGLARGLRKAGEHISEELADAMIVSIQGIAAGMQNTG